MIKSNPRGGPRSLLKRGPKAARTRAGATAASASEPPQACGVAADDVGLLLGSYRQLFAEDTKNADYFRVTHAIVTGARRWRKLANERLKVIGQTMARWETLFLVALSGEAITQGELARRISVEGPTMVRMLHVLAKDGLIARRQSSADRRVTTNRITAKGMRAIRDIMHVTDELRGEVMGHIDARRLEIFIDVLTQILSSIDARSGDPQSGTDADGECLS